LHSTVAWARAALALAAAGAAGLLLVSGGQSADPRTPPALPGMPAPFLGTVVVGSGGLTAAVDAYGDVVDLRAAPAGPALIDNPYERQLVGSVEAETGIVPRVSIEGGPALPPWRADSVTQRYLPGTNVVRTTARFGQVAVVVTDAAVGDELARVVRVRAPGGTATPALGVDLESGVRCEREAEGKSIALVCKPDPGESGESDSRIDSFGGRQEWATVHEQVARMIRAATRRGRAWLDRALPLGADAPAWATRMYERSLLALRAFADRSTGAIAAGARDGWAYVWPRDAGAVALAFAAAGYDAEAKRAARFLLGLDLDAAARFHGDGDPVEGRAAQGDAAGWVAVATRGAGLIEPSGRNPWRERADYREEDRGDFLANAVVSRAALRQFKSAAGLTRESGSGLDSAAAWAVRPFPHPALYPAVRETLLRLVAQGGRLGITPGEDWPGVDPWSAPTAWSAWSLAALGERRAALGLLADLRRAATPAGALPERIDVSTGVPRSTTPLAWSHAFAVLALRELWPAPRH
jgi:glucoamylase